MTAMYPGISKCQCGQTPHLKWCDDDGIHDCRQYAYFCECGEVGFQGDTPTEAMDRWERRAEIKPSPGTNKWGVIL